MGVFTNISGEVHLKSHINAAIGSWFDSDAIGSDLEITSKVMKVSDKGTNKKVAITRLDGDDIITTITRPTNFDISATIIMENTTTSVSDIISNLGDVNERTDIGSGIYGYDESDSKRRHRIAFIWKEDSDEYMKVYYNAYVQNYFMNDTEAGEIEISFLVPVTDIETGNPNYYEYEGSNASSALTLLDTQMNW